MAGWAEYLSPDQEQQNLKTVLKVQKNCIFEVSLHEQNISNLK